MRNCILIIFTILIAITSSAQESSTTDSACGTFGYACGIAGSPLQDMLRTIRLVNNTNKEPLFQWLLSKNPQDRVHGYIGLYFMKKNGVALTKAEEEQMQSVKKESTVIDCCEGCFFGVRREMRYLLADKNLKRYYNWYTKSGFIHLK